MQDLMVQYDIPLTVPYRALVSSASDANDGTGRDWGRGRRRLDPDDQRRFDSYYTRWLEYRRTEDRDQMRSMENRMRDVMRQYNIPDDVPFNDVASSDAGRSEDGNNLGIISASYGYGNQIANVSDRLRQLAQNGQLSITVNNDSMGGDPAPHRPKKLDLTYSYRGRTRSIVVMEGDTLSIP
jgi:hypothetical protein